MCGARVSPSALYSPQHTPHWPQSERLSPLCRPIACGGEILVSYGASYWLGRLPDPPKRYQFPDGSQYYGEVRDGQIHGHGEYVDAEGNRYIGEFANGSFEGVGTQFYLDGRVEACRYLAGEATGVGIGWTSNRAEAYRVVAAFDGEVSRMQISLEDASEMADSLGVPVPRP